MVLSKTFLKTSQTTVKGFHGMGEKTVCYFAPVPPPPSSPHQNTACTLPTSSAQPLEPPWNRPLHSHSVRLGTTVPVWMGRGA